MKQNHSRKNNKRTSLKKDNAVSSVVSEMLLLAIGIVLVGVFAISLVNLLPSDRDEYVDVVMHPDLTNKTLEFWHKGGDAISSNSLRVVVYNMSNYLENLTTGTIHVWNSEGNSSTVFDLGTFCNVSVPKLSGGEEVRLLTEKTIIYSGEVTKP